jgi:hypothetical protein
VDRLPNGDVAALLTSIQSGLRATLGSNLVGLYVFGSLTTDHFDEGVSDVDLIAALAAGLNPDEFARLDRFHAALVRDHPRWDNCIEIAYIAVAHLRCIRAENPIALISPGEPFHFTEAGGNWLFNLANLRDRGITLLGPPPQTLIDPISRADLVAHLRPYMREWRKWITETDLIHHRSYQGYMIITMCRCLYLWRNGEIAAKKQATAWAEHALPEWSSLIRNALRWRDAGDDPTIDPDATLPATLRFVHFVINTILAESSQKATTPPG